MTRIDATTVKQAAQGRWPEILRSLVPELSVAIDAGGRHVCCPLPGHDDTDPSFRFDDQAKGRAICTCGSYDGLGLLRKTRGWDFPTTLQQVAQHLGINGNGNGHPAKRDILTEVAALKQVSVESLKTYGAKSAYRNDCLVVRIPCYDESGTTHSHFDLGVKTDKLKKGMFRAGKGSAGLFFPGRLPKPGDDWILCEGVKDACAYHALGYLACGLNTDQMAAKYARLFRGVNVIIMPDRKVDAEEKALQTAGRLFGVAEVVRIGTLPLDISGRDGDDARDVLKLNGGAELLKQAVADAKPWEPENPEPDGEGISPIISPEGATEAANARRFAVEYGKVVLYCDAWQKWLVWDNKRWKPDDSRDVDALGKTIAVRLWNEYLMWSAQLADDDSESNAIMKAMKAFCKSSNSDRGIKAMLSLARSEPGIPITADKLDRDPWLFNVANGTIDLRSGKLRPHARTDFITKLAPVDHDDTAECPTWLDFLRVIMGGSDELIGFVRRLSGYCLTGSTQEHVFPFGYGTGANGKTTYINTMLSMLGEDYAIKAPTSLLLAKKDSHPTELADLHGKRLVACIEADEGRRLAEALVKELTGGDKIRARRMREDFWEFEATHKILLAANHKPTVRGTDHGIWRRIKLIPFSVVIPDDQQDKSLPDKLLDELPGILNWAVKGCLEWQQHGLGEPDSVKAATADYRAEMDTLGGFIEEYCVTADGLLEEATALFKAYRQWCDDNGQKPMNQTRFGLQLEERDYAKDRDSSTGRVIRHGIRLRNDAKS